MENQAKIVKFIEDKRKLKENGFNIFWLFDISFYTELQELYSQKVIKFEKLLDFIDIINENPPKKIGNFLMSSSKRNLKNSDQVLKGVNVIHAATYEGFCQQEVALIDDEQSNDSKQAKSGRFLKAFEKMIRDEAMIPDKSVLLISQRDHHQQKFRREKLTENQASNKFKKRESLSKVKGQKLMTDFYQSKKPVPYQKPVDEPLTFRYEVDAMAHKFRQNNVKILWLPTKSYELDASEYVSVILLNEIANILQNSLQDSEEDEEEEIDLKKHCLTAIDRFPNDVWSRFVERVENCEDFYLKRGSSCDEPKDEVDSD